MAQTISLKQLGIDVVGAIDFAVFVSQDKILDWNDSVVIPSSTVFLKDNTNLTTLQCEKTKLINIMNYSNKGLVGLAFVETYDKTTDSFLVRPFKYGTVTDATVGGASIKEYTENTLFNKDELVYLGNEMARVGKAFTSGKTSSSITLSDLFESDAIARNLIKITGGSSDTPSGNATIEKYAQDTTYEENSLIVHKNKLYLAAKKFISDTTKNDLDESLKLDITNKNLVAVTGQSEEEIFPYVSGNNYKEDTLVYLDKYVARVKQDFTASSISTDDKECFEDDLKLDNIILVNPDDDYDVISQYYPGNIYNKDSLIYLDRNIARVIKPFIADQTGTTANDSWDIDITAGNIILLNKEVEHIIKPYKQNNLFEKDNLVYAGKIIGRVLNDYISDDTQATLEESLNEDIKNGKLIEMGEKYKFKLYKTSLDLDKEIDAINTLPVSSITFEGNDDINSMNVNECIYGPLGTLALITNIDVNNGIIEAKSISTRDIDVMPNAPMTKTYTINLAGSGFSVGEVVPTDIPGVLVEVDAVDAGGAILSVVDTTETMTNANGTGQDISAEINFFVANGKQWYEMPIVKPGATLKAYTQGEEYEENNLIFLGDVLARALVSFKANDSLTTVDDSFKFDLDNNNLVRMTREDINVPECLGSVKTDTAADLPTLAIKGNWVLVENCTTNAPGQAGIGLYDGTNWNISPIPQGEFTFPEPSDDGKLYFRTRATGDTDGSWEVFKDVNGNDIQVTLKTKSDIADNSYVPATNELVWITDKKILVIGDGSTTIGSLKAFYENDLDDTDILNALGFTPEDASKKGQANGYAPLDANGKVPTGNLPDALTNTYSKTEIDDKDTAVTNALTTLVNTEATRAKAAEKVNSDAITAHITDNSKHVTQTEKDAWDAKVDPSDLTGYDNHLSDTVIHVTQADKDKWNGMTKAYYVTNKANLPTTGNAVGNIGYVQVSAAGVTPVVVDEYLWDGTAWKQIDAQQISLNFTWGNLQDKPASTVLSIDNAVTVAHNHTNKIVLDKIGQSAAGNFTYNGIEIGVRVVFLENENFLPVVGEADTLYVIYEDSRVRNYPSISVYRDNAYQVLGRGTQDAAPVVGDMSILQSEYFNVVKGSSYNITVTPNQYFAFMPLEILREIEGAKNQTKTVVELNDPANFDYDEYMLTIDATNKLKINIQERPTDLDTVSDFYYSHVDIDLSDFKDVDNIG